MENVNQHTFQKLAGYKLKNTHRKLEGKIIPTWAYQYAITVALLVNKGKKITRKEIFKYSNPYALTKVQGYHANIFGIMKLNNIIVWNKSLKTYELGNRFHEFVNQGLEFRLKEIR